MTSSCMSLQLIKEFYNETYYERDGEYLEKSKQTVLWSLTTAMFLPGGMIGAFSAGFVADKMGRLAPATKWSPFCDFLSIMH